MSQVKLTLRPPPNVDFVNGYPGIPPAGDRQQAAIKGAIEVRVAPQGVKAKWVRIELRKVETLPTGGPANTFFDFVGPSPVNLWQSSEEYAVLHTQDFPFYIRIPESIPPSIALENRAGIKYELVAAVCTKGKGGFLRRSKATVTSTMAPIIIDKHELHSTWPVYCQPERRHLAQEGVNLIVERARTCYGPGDRVAVMATLRSDSLHTVILRGFELTLKETTIFRMGPYANAKKVAPMVKHVIIGESKFPVNATLYGGTEHKAELSCEISQRHTTTSLNAARHIDITYILSVKALMGTGTHLIMDLPIIVSNWPRSVSVEAIRRIGPAMSLSRLPASSVPDPPPQASVPPTQPPPRVDTSISYSYAGRPNTGNVPPANPFGTSLTTTTTNVNKVNEFSRPKINTSLEYSGFGSKPSQLVSKVSASELKSTVSEDPSSKVPPSRTSRSVGNAPNRLTIANNPDEPEAPKIKTPQPQRSVGSQPTNASSSRGAWPTAEEEKRRLYDKARADVDRVQKDLTRGTTASQTQPTTVPSQNTSTAKPATQVEVKQSSRPPTRNTPWPTAEAEKLRLFNEAQATAKKTQALGTGSLHGRSNSDIARSGPSSKPVVPSTSLHEVPKAANSGSALSRGVSATSQVDNRGTKRQFSAKVQAPVPQYPSAEQEKAALRRYQEAKLAVDRTQGFISGSDEGQSSRNPISYESLYPSSSSGSASMSQPVGGNDLPPPFDGPLESQSSITEKEQLRRVYEAQDAAASARQGTSRQNSSRVVYNKTSPPPFINGSSSISPQNLPESGLGKSRPPASTSQAPLRNGSYAAGTRPTPTAPPVASGSRILTALEEKALLKSKYEVEERGARPNGTPVPPVGNVAFATAATPPTPPPLMPRPPAEYIQETREEDARVSRYVQQGITPSLDMPPANGPYTSYSPMSSAGSHSTPGLGPPRSGKLSNE